MGGIGDEEEFRDVIIGVKQFLNSVESESIQVLCFVMGKFVTDVHNPCDDNLAEEDNEKRPKQGVTLAIILNQSIWESRRVNF